MYQLGLDLQAVPSTFWLNRFASGAKWVAQTTCCSSSERSPAKHFTPSGSIQTRPSATATYLKTSVTGNLLCWLCDVSSASGASAAMYTNPHPRPGTPLLSGFPVIEVIDEDAGVSEDQRGHGAPRGRAGAPCDGARAAARPRRTAASPPRRSWQPACGPAASRPPGGRRWFPVSPPRSAPTAPPAPQE